jgi:deoxyribonuclease-4
VKSATPTLREAAATERLGAHVSTQGGMATAPARGVAIGATAIQVFTKTPNQWRDPVIDDVSGKQFRKAFSDSGLQAVIAHDSYLINLASPDSVLHRRSIAAFTSELRRCTTLGIPAVVSHPGNYMDSALAGLERNIVGYREALEAVPGPVKVLLETTAGSGTALGSTLEELAAIRNGLPPALRRRVAFCADTCHLYSAGYDLVNDFDGVWAEWDRILGLDHLHALHLNDSATPFNSHRDRHALLGEGSLGAEPFKRIMKDQGFDHVIKVLETPKGDDEVSNDRRMLRKLRAYAKQANP